MHWPRHEDLGRNPAVGTIGSVDIDAFVLSHQASWARLDHLITRRRRLAGPEVDELVDLYQRVSTHLSMVRSSSTDAVLAAQLSSLVARASLPSPVRTRPVEQFARFWTVSFPVVALPGRRWWLGTALAFVAVAVIIAVWVAETRCPFGIGHPAELDQLVNHDFASYYTEHPAASFARVWTNNAWVAAQCIAFAVLLGLRSRCCCSRTRPISGWSRA